jgi:hypothetical protein
MHHFGLVAMVVVVAAGCGAGGGNSDGGPNGGGTCTGRPFGVYTFKTTTPLCDPGWTASAGSFEVIFAAPLPDGGTGVKVDSQVCAESWQDCRVLVTCSSNSRTTFEVTYSSNDKFAGRAVRGCSCWMGSGGNDADCDVSGAK